MSPSAPSEPRPLAGEILFEEGDFHALSAGLARDPQYNDRRLKARRKLLALGKEAKKEIAESGVRLDARTSLHNPNTFNGMRVQRLWCYLTREKAAKRKLKGVLGPELAKDLDAAYKNAYLCLAIEGDFLEASFRVHPDGWYDGQNLKNRVEREGIEAWRTLLNELDGFQLRLHDWKGEWRCGALTPERLAEFCEAWVPGEHRLSVERRFPAPPGAREAMFSPEAPRGLLAELTRLIPLYRFAVWSDESDFLFSR